jgi:hypothetical protein
MRVLAVIIASDVSLLVTFNHAIDEVRSRPNRTQNDTRTSDSRAVAE